METYEVLPLAGAQKKQYCPPVGKNGAYSFYPATQFLKKLVSPVNWLYDNENIRLSDAWLTAIEHDIGASAFGYWTMRSDGQWFSNGLNLCVFPRNLIQIAEYKYRPARGGWWGRVDTLTYTPTPPDFASVPDYHWCEQTDENYMGQVEWGVDDTGHMVRFPLVSVHPVWILMDYLKPWIPGS